MRNFRIDYVYDGYRFWDVVRAENADQAIAYFEHLDAERSHCVASETTEDATYTVPDGWTRPQPPATPTADELAEWDAYTSWAWMRCQELDCDPEDVMDSVSFEEWREMVQHA